MSYYKLTKMSHKGWEFSTGHIDLIYKELSGCICNACRFTKTEAEEYANYPEWGYTEEEKQALIDDAFFPENYKELPHKEQISYFLSTACGAEYSFEEFEDYDAYLRGQVVEDVVIKTPSYIIKLKKPLDQEKLYVLESNYKIKDYNPEGTCTVVAKQDSDLYYFLMDCCDTEVIGKIN